MKNYNNFRRLLLRFAASAVAIAALLPGCTKVDDTLGGNLVPDNQQMKAGYTTLPGKNAVNPKKYVETRLFQTDSILASNISSGYLGSQLNDTLGLRTAGFLTQMANYYYQVDSGYFGYRPIFDSAQILLSIGSYGTDTLTEQTFAIYEVISNKYLTEKPITAGQTERDTAFYLNFDPEKEGVYDRNKKLFTFKLGGDKGPATTAVTLSPTAEGRAFVNRLMLQEGEHKGEYSLYSGDSLKQWFEAFKGLYICPDPDSPLTAYGKGSIFSTTLDESAFSIYGRNRVQNDPSLIKDTVGMVYYFAYDSSLEYGQVSVNVIDHLYENYNPATAEAVRIVKTDAEEKNENRPENPLVYVEGMGGVVTELTFAQPFFDDLEALIREENEKNGKDFQTLAFNQVRMSIYFAGCSYDWEAIDPTNPGRLIEEMDAAPNRLGLYTNYKQLAGVIDYNYIYENQYSTELAYKGYINRSHGCYVMDISGYIQQLWNSYMKEKQAAAAGNRAVDLDNVANRRVYIAPEAYSLYTTSFGVFQGMATDDGAALQNTAPIKFDVAYTMIK